MVSNLVAPTGGDKAFHLTLIPFHHGDDFYFTLWSNHIVTPNFMPPGLVSELMAFHMKGPDCSTKTGLPGAMVCFKTLSFPCLWQLSLKGWSESSHDSRAAALGKTSGSRHRATPTVFAAHWNRCTYTNRLLVRCKTAHWAGWVCWRRGGFTDQHVWKWSTEKIPTKNCSVLSMVWGRWYLGDPIFRSKDIR